MSKAVIPSPTVAPSPSAPELAGSARTPDTDAPATLLRAEFATTLRLYTEGDGGEEPAHESGMKRFAFLNMVLGADRSPYKDATGSRSWWAF